MVKWISRLLGLLREWPVALGALAVLSLALMPWYLPTEPNFLRDDLSRLRRARGLQRVGRHAEIESALQPFLTRRRRSPHAPEALVLIAEARLFPVERDRSTLPQRWMTIDSVAGRAYAPCADRLEHESAALAERACAEGWIPAGAPLPTDAIARAGELHRRLEEASLPRDAKALLAEVDQWADLARRATAVRERVGTLWESRGYTGRAARHFRRVYEDDLRPRWIRLEARSLGRAASRGDLELTLPQALDRLAFHDEVTPPEERLDGLLTRAEVLLWNGQTPDALAILDAALAAEADPARAARVRLVRGFARKRLGRTSEAREDLVAAGNEHPDPALRSLAQVHVADLMRLERDPRAVDRLEQLTTLDPPYGELARLHLGRALMLLVAQPDPYEPMLTALDRLEGAEVLEDNYIDVGPFFEELYADVAMPEVNPHRMEMVSRTLDRLRRLFPRVPKLYQQASLGFLRLARHYAERREAARRRGDEPAEQAANTLARGLYTESAGELVALAQKFGETPTEDLPVEERDRILVDVANRYFEGRLYLDAADAFLAFSQSNSEESHLGLFFAAFALTRAGIHDASEDGPGALDLFTQYRRNRLSAASASQFLPNTFLEVGRILARQRRFPEALETLQRVRESTFGLNPLQADQVEYQLVNAWGVRLDLERGRPQRMRSIYGLSLLESGRAALEWATSLRVQPDSKPGAEALGADLVARAERFLREYLDRFAQGVPPGGPAGTTEEGPVPHEAVLAYLLHARALLESDRHGDAVGDLRNALEIGERYRTELEPDELSALRWSYVLLGGTLEGLDRWPEAYDIYVRAHTRYQGHPDRVWALLGRARTALRLEPPRTREAIQATNDAERAVEESPEAYENALNGLAVPNWRQELDRLRQQLPLR